MKPAFRTRSVGTKVTEEEYAQLETCALARRLSISEWCRAVLLERAEGAKSNGADETLLAEVLALRTILLNLHFAIAKGEAITADEMQAIIDRADRDKEKKAAQRFASAADGVQL
jgi:mobilization protein NikA